MRRTVLERTWISFIGGLAIAAAAGALCWLSPTLWMMTGGIPAVLLLCIVAAIWSITSLVSLITMRTLRLKGRPDSEAIMIARLYRLGSFIFIALAIAYGFGRLGTFGALFSMFGGMLLGWSLQAPVSGFAAWMLVSIKRPFRPGDRIQFPNLNLTGDVKEIGAMYVVLDQVGGTVGSEEAVGRYILVPNAMLFSQVVINFTVKQQAPYMLDEVVARITYDSDMEATERILLEAARKITGDIIAATGQEPYIRSDLYDYGVYMRLRFQTKVQDRARIAYEINKEIIKSVQQTRFVDLAIPFIYSYRSGLAEMDRKDDLESIHREQLNVVEIEIAKIHETPLNHKQDAVNQLARTISVAGLRQPVVLRKQTGTDKYEITSGHLRVAACKKLGWKTIPATIRNGDDHTTDVRPIAAGTPVDY